jgi:endonuclease/exonuclease/phosphatase (EEP) superfamily protein YafD
MGRPLSLYMGGWMDDSGCMEEADGQLIESSGAVRHRKRWVTLVAWVVTLVCFAGCASWVVSGGVYVLDLAAGFLWIGVVVSVLVGLVLFGLKRWGAGLVCVLGVLVGAWPMLAGRPMVVERGGIGDVVVTVGSLNIYPLNEGWRDDLDVLMRLGLDVVVIQEISPEMNRMVSKYGYLDDKAMRYWVKRRWRDGEVSPGLIVSRYPLELIAPDEGDEMGEHQLLCIVDHPDKRFVVGLVHPFSPRSADRWEAGNNAVESHQEQIARAMDLTGLDVVVGADLNAAGAQVRARLMRGAGLRASKPIWPIQSGSFPADKSPLVRLQLDDVWRSEGVGVESWEMFEVGGSDHLGVVAQLILN